MTDRAYQVVCADSHVVEPPWVFERLPASLRDRAPRVMAADGGGEGWSFDGASPKRSFGLEAMAGRGYDQYEDSGLSFSDIMTGCFDGAAHLADMDLDGVDASVIYPTNATELCVMEDRQLAVACMRAYNDWLFEDYVSANPRRLIGLPMLPVDDGMAVATEELRRVVANGAHGAWLPGAPRVPYVDPGYDPLWATATELDVALSFHRANGGPSADVEWDRRMPGVYSLAGIVYRFFSAVRPLTYMIFSGIFERFPTLRIVAGEVNVGWVPFWAQMMDQAFEKERTWAQLPLNERPSSALGRNAFVTILDDAVGFQLMDDGLAKVALFSTDYPHSVTLWPHTQAHIAELTAGMAEPLKRQILSDNAVRVYRLA